MIISQAEYDSIFNRRIRRRELHFPVQHGKLGERKKPPARVGGVYELKARAPYARFRAEAERQPTAARAVLWLIDCCEAPTRTVTITVREIERLGDTWVIRFVLGDQRATFDRPRLPARAPGYPHGDYVTSASVALDCSDDEVPADVHKIYAADGWERHAAAMAERRERLLVAVIAIRSHGGSPRANRALREAEQRVKALDRRSATYPLRRAV